MQNRKYDFLCFFDPKLSEEECNNLIARFSERITQNGGQVDHVSTPLRRPIYIHYKKDKNLKETTFVQMAFSGPPSLPPILNELVRLTETVIRFVITQAVPLAPVVLPESQNKEKDSDQVEIAPEFLGSSPESKA